jgi:hypothetical protein
VKTYPLIDADGNPYRGTEPGTLGGYRRGPKRIYGRLDCKNALRWIAAGHYVRFRVFFTDEATAIAAGHRPCGKCLKAKYDAWKAANPNAMKKRRRVNKVQ